MSVNSDVVEENTIHGDNQKVPENYVGFECLLTQIRRISKKKGWKFNLMLVGESGLGKSTLINTLFRTDFYNIEQNINTIFGELSTREVSVSTFDLQEGGVKLQLTVIETPPLFGADIDNDNCWDSISQYIENRFEDYYSANLGIRHAVVQDTRVHCCLYFLSPNGLKPLDIEIMKILSKKVNIVPVIAKADTLTEEECQRFKEHVLEEINANQINIYTFPPLDKDDNCKIYRERIPFAVVGSNLEFEVGGVKTRVRKYPWGVLEVENLKHCDLTALQSLLIKTHMQHLINVTNDVHYENFRSQKLSAAVSRDDQIEREIVEFEKRLQAIEKEDKEFQELLKKKEKNLKDKEIEFIRKNTAEMKKLEQTRKLLIEQRTELEKEKNTFNTIPEISCDRSAKGMTKKHLFLISTCSLLFVFYLYGLSKYKS